MRKKNFFLILLILSIFFIGCTAKYVGKSYDGPELPDNEVGTVIFNDLNKMFRNQAVIPCKVDGVRVSMNPEDRSVDMLPGEHKVLFMYDGKGPLVTIEWTFKVEAGHRYMVTFDEGHLGSQFKLWIEDLTVGKRLTDITSSPLKGAFSCF